MDTIRNRCLHINLSLVRAQITIHSQTVRDCERNRLQGSRLPQGQMRCAISEILGLTSSKKSASPRSVASWPGKYGYPSLACGDRVTGHNHRRRINPTPPSGSQNSRSSPARSPAVTRPRRGGASRGPCRGKRPSPRSAKKRPWRRQWWSWWWRGVAASLLLGSGMRGGRGRRRWRGGTGTGTEQPLVMTMKPSSDDERVAVAAATAPRRGTREHIGVHGPTCLRAQWAC
jgi:hypothetical protein